MKINNCYFNLSILSLAPGNTCFPFLSTPSTSKHIRGELFLVNEIYIFYLIPFHFRILYRN